MPKVYNKRDKYVPQDAVYIGRPTPWGNPFTHLTSPTKAEIRVRTRDDSVKFYDALVRGDMELFENFTPALKEPVLTAIRMHMDWIQQHLHELKGCDLVCWCAPLACHGDILLAHANKED